MADDNFKVIMVTDSRSQDLNLYTEDWDGITLDIVKAPSTGIEAAVEILIAQKRDVTPNAVFIMNGICDILVKNKTTHRYFMLNDTVEETVQHYMKQVKRGQELLEIFYDESLWVFNPITGADICDYNTHERRRMTDDLLVYHHHTKTPDPLQPVMDQAVLDINTRIGEVNWKNNVVTPYTASFVHRRYKGAYHHSYQYTSDGCHLTEEGKKYWAKQVKNSIEKTKDKQKKKLLK